MIKTTFFQFSFFILIAAATIFFIHHHFITQDAHKPGSKGVHSAFSKPFLDITGFRYTRTENTQRKFVIQADRLYLQKRKIGFVRFGLMKELIIDNATINFYKASDQKIDFETLIKGAFKAKSNGGLTPEAGMLPKSLSKILISPVTLKILSEEGKPITTISANSLTFNLKNRPLVFDGNVQIHSGNRVLNAHSLSVISNDGRLIARHNAMLKTPERTIIRDVLQTDMFLNIDKDTEKGDL